MMTGPASLNDAQRPAALAAPAPLATATLRACLWALLGIGVLVRLAPFLAPETRMYWQYMSEDGYLMQTIARNMAIGLGMSTAEGTIATNGVQPLATFLFAGLHALAGGDKFTGIALVMAASVVAALGAAACFHRVARHAFAALPFGGALAAAAALLWFASPLIVGHSMNGLETGIYYLVLLGTLALYLQRTAEGSPPLGLRDRALLGLMLGLTFLARNDAVFFIGGLLLAHVAVGGAAAGGGWRHRAVDAVAAGLISMVVALPWLVNNVMLFGTIVPISGIAQYGATLGANLLRTPAILFENAFGFLPVPNGFEERVPVAFFALLLVCAAVAVYWRTVARLRLGSRRFFVGGLCFVAAAVGYYGGFFGAPHFLTRYFSALSPFLFMAACGAAGGLLLRLRPAPAQGQGQALGAVVACVAVLTLAAAAFAVPRLLPPPPHMHRQVVDWAQANVTPDTWVGAVQTGTLGYFHDRTINLDGKVNPAALRAHQRDGDILPYVVESPIRYVIDWVGLAGWVASDARFAAAFEVAVKDGQANLAVLRRKAVPAAAPASAPAAGK